jgi:hypothetical protein
MLLKHSRGVSECAHGIDAVVFVHDAGFSSEPSGDTSTFSRSGGELLEPGAKGREASEGLIEGEHHRGRHQLE